MVRLARSPILIPIVLLIAGPGAARAQPRQRENRPRTASISGRITAEGRPLSGVAVTIERFSASLASKPLRDKTDAEGLYKRILVMQRLEIDGLPVRGPIRLEEDQQLSGVRIVMTYGSGVVRGQVKSQNGEAPKGFCFEVYTSREQDNVQGFTVFPYRAQVSAGGQYSLEDLPPGDYELMLRAKPCATEKFPEILPVKHRVRVVNGTEALVDFVVDLGAMKLEGNQ